MRDSLGRRRLATDRLRFAALVAGVITLASAVAEAHPLVDEGLRQLRGADFFAAIDAFDRAEQARDLELPDLLRLLEGHAMAALALRDTDAMATCLARLAAVDREHRFSAEAPPELRAAFDRAREGASEPLALDVRADRDETGVLLQTSVRGDPGGLVRGVRVAARPDGADWQQWDLPSVHVPARPEQAVEYRAEARGPGQALLLTTTGLAAALREGEAAPAQQVATRILGEVAEPSDPNGRDEPRRPAQARSGGLPWAWIGASAALMTATAVLTALAVSAGGSSGSSPATFSEGED